MDFDYNFVRERITELRMKLDISEYQMSLELGQNKGYIHDITSGGALPSLKQLYNICDYLGVTISEFFDASDHDSPQLRETVHELRKLSEDEIDIIAQLVRKLAARHT